MILFQDHTKTTVEATIANSAHALLLTGSEGAGKTYIARHIVRQKLGLAGTSSLDKYPYFKMVSPDNTVITIEQIRELQKFLQLKTLGKAPLRRAIILKDAHLMTTEAQNALLKALEEPPADTLIILTAPATLQLKDTIYSRVQQLQILPVSKQQALEYFGDQFDPASIEKAYAMSGGLVGLVHALLHDQDHVLTTQIQTAKEVLSATPFDRLIKVDELSKHKEQLPDFLQACKLICFTALDQAAGKGNKAQTKQWHARLARVHQAEAALVHNPSSKLLLTDLFLQM